MTTVEVKNAAIAMLVALLVASGVLMVGIYPDLRDGCGCAPVQAPETTPTTTYPRI